MTYKINITNSQSIRNFNGELNFGNNWTFDKSNQCLFFVVRAICPISHWVVILIIIRSSNGNHINQGNFFFIGFWWKFQIVNWFDIVRRSRLGCEWKAVIWALMQSVIHGTKIFLWNEPLLYCIVYEVEVVYEVFYTKFFSKIL